MRQRDADKNDKTYGADLGNFRKGGSGQLLNTKMLCFITHTCSPPLLASGVLGPQKGVLVPVSCDQDPPMLHPDVMAGLIDTRHDVFSNMARNMPPTCLPSAPGGTPPGLFSHGLFSLIVFPRQFLV